MSLRISTCLPNSVPLQPSLLPQVASTQTGNLIVLTATALTVRLYMTGISHHRLQKHPSIMGYRKWQLSLRLSILGRFQSPHSLEPVSFRGRCPIFAAKLSLGNLGIRDSRAVEPPGSQLHSLLSYGVKLTATKSTASSPGIGPN